MIPEIGHFALIVALMLAMVQGVLPIYGAARGNAVLMGLARPVAIGQFVFVATAFGCLAYAFLTSDFSVLYVAEHSNSQLPAHYRFAALWGGHEGSLLLWTFLLTIWTVAVTQFSKHLPQEMVARVIGVLGLICAALGIDRRNKGERARLEDRGQPVAKRPCGEPFLMRDDEYITRDH